MTAVALPPGEQTFFLTKIDVNGQPYTVPNAGGFVYMYEPGSSVPRTTWLDSAQTTANTDPIRLDPNGRCIIYGVGQYRQIVTDAAGDVQWDQLTELGIDQTFINDTLLNSPVLVDGPNPNPPLSDPDQGMRPLAAVLGSFVDARNGRFGALRQGGDDLVTIQAAINYAASIGGATVYLGPGPLTTQPTTQLVWPAAANGVSLKGDGPMATVLTINGNLTQDVMVLTAGNLAHCQIRDLGFVSSGAPIGGALIHFANAYAAHVENVRMSNAFWNGIFLEGGTNQYLAQIRDVIAPASVNTNACILVGSDGSIVQGIYIDDCKLAASAFGIYVRNASGVVINSSECLNHTQSGVITAPAPGRQVRSVQMNGLISDTCTGAAFNLGDSGGNTSFVTMTNCSANASQVGVLIGANPQENNITVEGCEIVANQQSGIHNVGANAVIITGNLLAGNGAQTPNTYDAILIESGIQNVVSNNFIGAGFGFPAHHRYALTLGGPTDYIVAFGNVTGGGGTGTFNNGSAGTHNVVANACVGT